MELYPDKIKGFISIDSAPLQKSYMTAVEIWLLERAEPLYKIYPWKVLLRAGSRGCAETDYGQNLMRKMMMSYDSDPEEYARLAEKFFYQSVYFIRLVSIGIMTGIFYPFKR